MYIYIYATQNWGGWVTLRRWCLVLLTPLKTLVTNLNQPQLIIPSMVETSEIQCGNLPLPRNINTFHNSYKVPSGDLTWLLDMAR